MQPSAASLVSCDLEPVHEIIKLHFPVLVHGSLFFVTQIPSVTLAVISPRDQREIPSLCLKLPQREDYG